MKRIFLIIAISLLSLTSWMAVEADAQNKVFSKYSEMDNVDYICITKSMLKLLGNSSATINGVHIEGITNAINVILIINSGDDEVSEMMKKDYKILSSDPNYEVLMCAKSDGERVTTLLNVTKTEKEVVMYIDEKDELTFIVLTGTFTDEQLKKLLDGNK